MNQKTISNMVSKPGRGMHLVHCMKNFTHKIETVPLQIQES